MKKERGVALSLKTAEFHYLRASELGHEKGKTALAKVRGKIQADNNRHKKLNEESLQPIKKVMSSEVKRGCFITTAVCLSLGKGDDCEEILILKKYRDTWLVHQEQGQELIEKYYAIAPGIVRSIDKREKKKEIYKNIYEEYLRGIMSLLSQDKYIEVRERYVGMVEELAALYDQ